MPALVNSSVGSFCGTSDDEWTSLCPLEMKKSRNLRRTCDPVSIRGCTSGPRELRHTSRATAGNVNSDSSIGIEGQVPTHFAEPQAKGQLLITNYQLPAPPHPLRQLTAPPNRLIIYVLSEFRY